MKGLDGNGFVPIIAQAIAEMEETHGEFKSIDEINLAELSRRTGLLICFPVLGSMPTVYRPSQRPSGRLRIEPVPLALLLFFDKVPSLSTDSMTGQVIVHLHSITFTH